MTMKLSTLFLTAILCSGSVFADEAPTITVQKFAFTPKEITVTPGTKVKWVNKDETPHTVSTSDKSFMSKAMDTDDTYEYTFVNGGDFSYFCTLHPFMTGVVHVHAGK
jgi:plastocyanin